MAYELEGQLLEVCTCNVLCPCWVGEDPDGGTCDGVLSWHVETGKVNGTDVSGRTLTILAHIPGNILDGNWKVVVYVDDGASDEQQQALLDVWTGKLGGPVADLAQLVGEVMAVERLPVTFQVEGKTFTASPSNTVGDKLSELKEGDKVRVDSADDTANKEPYNALSLQKVE